MPRLDEHLGQHTGSGDAFARAATIGGFEMLGVAARKRKATDDCQKQQPAVRPLSWSERAHDATRTRWFSNSFKRFQHASNCSRPIT